MQLHTSTLHTHVIRSAHTNATNFTVIDVYLQGGTEVVSEEINTDPLNPETQKMIEIAKQREDHLVEVI